MVVAMLAITIAAVASILLVVKAQASQVRSIGTGLPILDAVILKPSNHLVSR